MYGIKLNDAKRLILNVKIDRIITVINNTISSYDASTYILFPKNIIDQKKFRINCTIKSVIHTFLVTIIALLFLVSYISIRKSAIPISIYSIVHTIGNKNPGGASGGLATLSKWNIISLVKYDDKPPTASGVTIQAINSKTLFNSVFLVHLLKICALNNLLFNADNFWTCESSNCFYVNIHSNPYKI